jgi:TPR repeat protein
MKLNFVFAIVLLLLISACSSKKSDTTAEPVAESQPVAVEPAPTPEPVSEPQPKAAPAVTRSQPVVAPVTATPVQAESDATVDSFKQRLEKITGKTYPTNKELQEQAEKGDVGAQAKLARSFWDEGNYDEAKKWYLKAAEQNDASAQHGLGVMYVFGQGVEQNYTEAIKWFGLAAAQGDAESQFSLGMRYSRGDSVPQDFAEAIKWFNLSASQGVPEAQMKLGDRYANGEGTTQDYVEAYKWYAIAAKDHPDAVQLRDDIESKMTADQIAQGKAKAAAFVPQKMSK